MTYTVTANGKVMYRTDSILGGTATEAAQRANEVAAIVRKGKPAATVLVVMG